MPMPHLTRMPSFTAFFAMLLWVAPVATIAVAMPPNPENVTAVDKPGDAGATVLLRWTVPADAGATNARVEQRVTRDGARRITSSATRPPIECPARENFTGA